MTRKVPQLSSSSWSSRGCRSWWEPPQRISRLRDALRNGLCLPVSTRAGAQLVHQGLAWWKGWWWFKIISFVRKIHGDFISFLREYFRVDVMDFWGFYGFSSEVMGIWAKLWYCFVAWFFFWGLFTWPLYWDCHNSPSPERKPSRLLKSYPNC